MVYIFWTSWFFYKDRKWVFYPKDLKYSEWLDFYTRYFNWLEINSSFYRLPSKSTISKLCKIDINYIFKLHRNFTHFKKYDKNFLFQFLEILRPLKELKKLNWLLFQFSNKATKKQIFQCLEFVRKYEKDIFFYVELRNLDLIKDFYAKEVVKVLKDLRSSLVYVDWRLKNNILIYEWMDLGFSNCYFRFHWRWEKVYDRDYTEDELRKFVDDIKQICSKKEKCFVFFNNTIKAQAVKNVLYLKKLIISWN